MDQRTQWTRWTRWTDRLTPHRAASCRRAWRPVAGPPAGRPADAGCCWPSASPRRCAPLALRLSRRLGVSRRTGALLAAGFFYLNLVLLLGGRRHAAGRPGDPAAPGGAALFHRRGPAPSSPGWGSGPAPSPGASPPSGRPPSRPWPPQPPRPLPGLLQSLSAAAARAAAGLLAGLPVALLGGVFTVVLSFYLAADYRRVTRFLRQNLPEPGLRLLGGPGLWPGGGRAAAAGVRCAVSCHLRRGGSGAVAARGAQPAGGGPCHRPVRPAAPWSAAARCWCPGASGRRWTAGCPLPPGCGCSSASSPGVRSILEPRLVGSQTGLHPLALITALFAGLRLFGAAGALLVPLGVLFLCFLNRRGVVRLFRPASE